MTKEIKEAEKCRVNNNSKVKKQNSLPVKIVSLLRKKVLCFSKKV